ncbi:polyamine aminopropyltransferase [Photobacterium leiognathi]|uniref:polyamine aminopropyltransferase n=1 Tax=Photobacterium leiognathi TaxID=553611 RepID=UPI002738F7F4|nr:polyamine aminopropyltransferase [Photobacterium leiognathi]
MLVEKRYFETLHNGYGQYFDVTEILFEQKTPQWHLIIFNNPNFGRVMALNGIIQTTERDEFIYHETLTHTPILAHGNVKSVLIIGGGDGGILREVVKHQDIEHITMVEIDNTVVDMCKTYFPNHSACAYDDPRVNLVISDGADFVNKTSERFDVIISDCTDPVGPGEALFEYAFYAGCKRCLDENGIFVAQNGVPFMQIEELTTSQQRLSAYFSDVTFYTSCVPTYVGGQMALAWGTENHALRKESVQTISERYNASNIVTKYYNPHIHVASFALPNFVSQAIKNVANNQR